VQDMIELIKRPVAMRSNLHDAVFRPETLDLWVADAGRATPACDEPYAHFNLGELLSFYRKAAAESAPRRDAAPQAQAGR
jgi:isopenicillin-N N-acyltransferase like protein